MKFNIGGRFAHQHVYGTVRNFRDEKFIYIDIEHHNRFNRTEGDFYNIDYCRRIINCPEYMKEL